MATRVARVLSVNVGTVREFEYNGRPAKSAIWKSPVAGRIAARGPATCGAEYSMAPSAVFSRPVACSSSRGQCGRI
jgi:hypothetical protein